ncbi:MAG: esterase-like activity of phytase family protein [Motiliproteus sp.]
MSLFSLSGRLLFCCLLLLSSNICCAETTADSVAKLQLIRALELESDASISGLQPSGLAFCDGQLLMVSDRHNQQIFSLQLTAESAQVVPFLTLTAIPDPDLEGYDLDTRWWNQLSRRYDWEGVSCDKQGNIYLLSETLAQVLVRDKDGALAWLGTEAYQRGQEKGLFQQINAYAEGLAVVGEQMVIAAERHPRGILLLNVSEDKRWRVSRVKYLEGFPSLFRPVDFSGLWLESDWLYTLERNYFQICKRQLATLDSQRCWQYRHVEEDQRWIYQDRRFGKAEGLARNGNQIYLVLDNNDGSRLSDPDNSKPLLFIFQRPDDW